MDGWLTGSGRPKNPGGMYRRQEKEALLLWVSRYLHQIASQYQIRGLENRGR